MESQIPWPLNIILSHHFLALKVGARKWCENGSGFQWLELDKLKLVGVIALGDLHR